MSHRPYKKTKNTKDLLEEKDQLESLKSALIPIYLSCSEEDLMCVIKTKLPDLCQVDSIELSRQKIKKSNSVYSYSFIYKDTAYFIHFHKEKSIERKNILKKIGKALESTLIYLEQSERLKTNKEQWELAFDTIPMPICLTDTEGRILRTNKFFREKTKKSKTELARKHYFSVFFGKPDKTTSLQSHKEKRQERLLINEEEKTFEIFIQKIARDTKKTIQLVILRDITKQTQMEYKIALSAKSAELGIISSSIAHELNNPIAGVQALLQTLQIQDKNNNLSEDLKEMSLAIQRCSHIIDQLLNIHH